MDLHDIYCTTNSFKQYTVSELFEALEILILFNKDTYCVTNILFELCAREFQKIINLEQDFYCDNVILNRLTNFAEQIYLQRRLRRDKFNSLCRDMISKEQIPLEIFWWLHSNNLFYLEDYWATKSILDINSQLKQFVTTYIEKKLDNLSGEQYEKIEIIIRDIFTKLFLVSKSQSSSPWFVRIRNIYEYYLEDALEELIHSKNVKLICFLNVFNNGDTLYGIIIKEMCKNIILKLFNYKENTSIFEVIETQELWSTKNLEINILDFYFQLIKRFTLEELLEFISQIQEDKLNFQFVLVLIAVYISKLENSFKQLKSIIYRNFQTIFSEETCFILHSTFSDVSHTLFNMCLIRQCCLEQENSKEVYSDWFANTLGCNSILKCGSDTKSWALLLGALVEALPHEPCWVLKVHSSRALRAPAMCNKDAQGYKEACKNKLSKVDCNESNRDSQDFL